MNRCSICLQSLSMRDETRDRRYWDKEMQGWAHIACDPSRPPCGPEEELLLAIFGRASGNRQVQHSREDAATADMAAARGHRVSKERQPFDNMGTPSLLKRAVCTCGFASPWSLHEKDATTAKRAHLKDAAVYSP